jgi:hypothetical protein
MKKTACRQTARTKPLRSPAALMVPSQYGFFGDSTPWFDVEWSISKTVFSAIASRGLMSSVCDVSRQELRGIFYFGVSCSVAGVANFDMAKNDSILARVVFTRSVYQKAKHAEQPTRRWCGVGVEPTLQQAERRCSQIQGRHSERLSGIARSTRADTPAAAEILHAHSGPTLRQPLRFCTHIQGRHSGSRSQILGRHSADTLWYRAESR